MTGGDGSTSSEVGTAGVLRFFQRALGKEISWMLPFALAGIFVLIFTKRLDLKDLADSHKGVLVWGTWLVTCLVFFSMASHFHVYYMIMLAPPIAALCGGLFGWLFEKLDSTAIWVRIVPYILFAATIAFQIYLALQFIDFSVWLFVPREFA
jgi:4-amino-4-deoxy-L-arabinose transferase-like glycosyltransferase